MLEGRRQFIKSRIAHKLEREVSVKESKGSRLIVHDCGSARREVSLIQQKEMTFHSVQVQEVVTDIHKMNNRSFNEFPYVDFISNKNVTVSQFASLHFQKHLTGTCHTAILILGNPLSFCSCLYIGKDKIIQLNFKTIA